jgi:hypothetical protein
MVLTYIYKLDIIYLYSNNSASHPLKGFVGDSILSTNQSSKSLNQDSGLEDAIGG